MSHLPEMAVYEAMLIRVRVDKSRVTELKRIQAQLAAELERLQGSILVQAFRGEL